MKFLGAHDDNIGAGFLIPPHGVARPDHFKKIVASMEKRGWKGRRLVVVCDDTTGGMYRSLTGSHRIAAAGSLSISIPCRVLSFDKLDTHDAKQVFGWNNGYHELRHWIRKFDKQAARIFSWDLK